MRALVPFNDQTRVPVGNGFSQLMAGAEGTAAVTYSRPHHQV